MDKKCFFCEKSYCGNDNYCYYCGKIKLNLNYSNFPDNTVLLDAMAQYAFSISFKTENLNELNYKDIEKIINLNKYSEYLIKPHTKNKQMRNNPLSLALKSNDENLVKLLLDNLTHNQIIESLNLKFDIGDNIFHILFNYGAIEMIILLIEYIVDNINNGNNLLYNLICTVQNKNNISPQEIFNEIGDIKNRFKENLSSEKNSSDSHKSNIGQRWTRIHLHLKYLKENIEKFNLSFNKISLQIQMIEGNFKLLNI